MKIIYLFHINNQIFYILTLLDFMVEKLISVYQTEPKLFLVIFYNTPLTCTINGKIKSTWHSCNCIFLLKSLSASTLLYRSPVCDLWAFYISIYLFIYLPIYLSINYIHQRLRFIKEILRVRQFRRSKDCRS